MTAWYLALAGLAILVVLNLILTTAMIRRLRDIEQRQLDAARPPDGWELGSPLPIEALTERADLTGLTAADLTGAPVLFGFFSTTCRYCPDEARRLADRSARLAADGVRVVSVVSTLDGKAAPPELAELLDGTGRVVVEPEPGTLGPLLRVAGTPSYLYFDGSGRLAGKGISVDEAYRHGA
jgi:hypothetical protein